MAQVPEFCYKCDACEEGISPAQPRVHCLECEDHDLCMICHSLGNVSKNPWHKPLHSNKVISPSWIKSQNPRTPATIHPHASPQPTEEPPANISPLQWCPQAAQYWGILRSAEGTASPMFARLCAAIFNHFDATVDPVNTNLMEPSKVAAAEEAMGLFGNWNIALEPQNGVLKKGGTIDEGDELIAVSWTAREMAHVMTTRQSENPVLHGMPALTVEGFSTLHMRKLGSDPEAYWKDINNLLKEIPELVDPVTGKGFKHCKIPLSCFPPGPVPEVVAMIKRIDEVLVPAAGAWCERWNERKKQEVIALEHSHRLAMQQMNMMHSQRMMAMSVAFQFPQINHYIR